MDLIRPFAGLRPAPGRAADVIAPPYDVITSEEARVHAEGRPWSFLHISKPEIDLPSGTDPYSPRVYAVGAENLARMVSQRVLVRDAHPYYYVYRMVLGEHEQTGIAAVGSLAHYASNRIRRHELTTPEKEDDRVRQIDTLNAQTGPVMAAYPEAPAVDEMLAVASRGAPAADAVDINGTRHSLWVVSDPQIIGRLTRAFEALPCIYIADGHHRTAAAARVAATRRASARAPKGDESYESFLTVAFPVRQMRILDYNRLVKDFGGLTTGAFLARAGERFDVTASSAPIKPAKPGEFGLFVGGRWYRLTIRKDRMPSPNSLDRLDVRLLSHHLMEPVLGIVDNGRDGRVTYVGGSGGLEEMERRVRSGEMAAAITLCPVRMADVIAVSDAGDVMPPKVTWFAPKLADGIISHVLD